MSDSISAHAVRCPSCAAPVEAPPGDVLRCPYCGTKSRMSRVVAARVASGAPHRGAGAGAGVTMVALVVLGLGGAAYFLLIRGESSSPAVPPSPATVARPMTPAGPTPAVAPPPFDPPEVAPEPPHAEMNDMFSAKPTDSAIAVRWTAKVKKASGPVKRGQKCEIVGHIEDAGESVRPLDVRCKGELLYSTTQKFSGMANMSTGATEVKAKDGSSRWHLRFDDTGSRSKRAQIRLDSAAGMGRVWSDELPPFDIELTIDPEGKPDAPR